MDIQALTRIRYSMCTCGVFPWCAGKTSRIVPLHPQGWTKIYFKIDIHSKWQPPTMYAKNLGTNINSTAGIDRNVIECYYTGWST